MSTSRRSSPYTGMVLEFTVLTGTKLPPTSSVWKLAALTRRRPLSSTRVLPVPRLRRLKAPTSPRAELTPPLMFSASLKKFCPCSGSASSRSSPESTPNSSMSCASTTDTGRTPLMLAPRMWVPVTTTSSITSPRSPCATASEATKGRIAKAKAVACAAGRRKQGAGPARGRGAKCCRMGHLLKVKRVRIAPDFRPIGWGKPQSYSQHSTHRSLFEFHLSCWAQFPCLHRAMRPFAPGHSQSTMELARSIHHRSARWPPCRF